MFSFFLRRKICISKNSEIYYTIRLHIIYFLFFKFGYEYADFQFSQNDGYAQRLYISIFFFIKLKKITIKNKEPRQLDS